MWPEEREHVACKKYKDVSIIKIGGHLKSGKKRGDGTPNYDD